MTGIWEIWEILEQLHFVERFWQMSLLACTLTGFVLLLRLFLKGCARVYSYGLWLLVLLRLLCPVLIESDYSVQPPVLSGEAPEETGQQVLGQYAKGRQMQEEGSRPVEGGFPAEGDTGHGIGRRGQAKTGGIDAGGEGVSVKPSVPDGMADPSYQPSGQNPVPLGGKAVGSTSALRAAAPGASFWERGWRRWTPWLRGIYLSGAAAFLLYFAALYIGWRRRLSAAVRQRENIWYSERVSSPFVLGVLRPRIYLPYGLDTQEENHILLHEQTHIRHMDPLLRLLGTLALCLHWWNPLVWLGIRCFYQDMEMFCDEAAMGKSDLAGRRAYAETLLHFAVKQSGPGMALAAVAGGAILLTVPSGSGDTADLSGQGGIPGAETEKRGQSQAADSSQNRTDRELEKLQNLVLSQSQVSPVEGQTLTLQLVMTEGVRYTREQVPESLFAENYEGSYQLRALDAQGQILDAVKLTNEQGGGVMNFPFRDFPWYFEDYNLDGQQDFFLGTKAADNRSFHYLMTVTAEGELKYLYDGPMWESYVPMTAQDITHVGLESAGGEQDFRTLLLYQANAEYSSHDYYVWSSYFEAYRKNVVFKGVYPEGQDQEASDYLEGTWRISGVDMWDQERPRPDNRIGEVLCYDSGTFRQMSQAGDVEYEHAIAGIGSLLQSKEEFWNTYSMSFPGDDDEPVKRILVNMGNPDEGCELGNVIYVVNENEMLVYDLWDAGIFWTVTREELRGETGEIQAYLQGAWEITDIAGRPYEALEQEEAEAFLGTRLTYDWQNTAGEYTIEGVWNYSLPVRGFDRSVDSSDNWPPEAGLSEGELQWWNVYLGEGEFFGSQIIRMDEDTVWIYYMGTFFRAKRAG